MKNKQRNKRLIEFKDIRKSRKTERTNKTKEEIPFENAAFFGFVSLEFHGRIMERGEAKPKPPPVKRSKARPSRGKY